MNRTSSQDGGEAAFEYHVHCSISGETSHHTNPICAAQAFYLAAAADRPCVIRTQFNSASTIARTMRIGDGFVKSLPFETDPAFTQAYRAFAQAHLFDPKPQL